MISTISHHADRAAALLDQLPRGALPSERAAIVQQAIDAALAVTPVSIELSQMLALVKRDVDAVVDRIREATDGALDGCCINEAVAILISQRDNARDAAEHYRGDSLKLKAIAPKLEDCTSALEREKKSAKTLHDRINEIALALCADYPGIATAQPHEQLYAIDATAKGTNAANEDCHKVIGALRIRCGMTELEVVQLWEQVAPMLPLLERARNQSR